MKISELRLRAREGVFTDGLGDTAGPHVPSIMHKPAEAPDQLDCYFDGSLDATPLEAIKQALLTFAKAHAKWPANTTLILDIDGKGRPAGAFTAMSSYMEKGDTVGYTTSSQIVVRGTASSRPSFGMTIWECPCCRDRIDVVGGSWIVCGLCERRIFI